MSVPPGASYQPSNTYRKIKRRLLNLEAPVRVEFKERWRNGNPLYDWLQRRTHPQIEVIQLRKERRSPFLHEYVAFRLTNRECFRIDRRQLSDKSMSLDRIYEYRVKAYEAIEQIASLEDASYSDSDCLAMIGCLALSHNPLTIEFVLKSLWAIHSYPPAKIYTLQRYNCHFFAQTILLLAAKEVTKIDWKIQPPTVDNLSAWRSMEHLYNCESSPVYQYNPYFTITESSENILPQTITYLIQQTSRHDQGFHTMCLTHWKSCSLCNGQRTPFSSSRMTFNAAGKVSNQSNRETNSSETRLSHFHSSLMGFWRNKLSVILKEQNTEKAVLVERLYEAQLKQSEPRAISKQVISQVLDELFVLDREMQSSWTTCVREALEQLVKHLDPIVQCVLECPTWEPLLTPEINKGNVVYFRNMNNWMDCITSLFESEYDRLEKALKAEIVCYWFSALRSQLSKLPVMYLRNRKSAKKLGPVNRATNELKIQASRPLIELYKLTQSLPRELNIEPADTQEISNYLDILVMAHDTKVEQCHLWLKCAQDDIYVDVSRAREDVWEVVRTCSENWTPSPV